MTPRSHAVNGAARKRADKPRNMVEMGLRGVPQTATGLILDGTPRGIHAGLVSASSASAARA